MQSNHCLISVTLTDSFTIFGTNINVHVNEVSHRELSNLTESRISLETLILRNPTGKSHSPAMKQTIHIRGVDNLVE